MKISIHQERWPAVRPFRIAGREWTCFDSIVVEVAAGDVVGRGEGAGVFYLGDTLERLEAEVEAVAAQVFIPMTVGGGVRSVADVRRLLNAGADKVSINTAAVQNPQLVADASARYGAQCIVGAVDARRMPGYPPYAGVAVPTAPEGDAAARLRLAQWQPPAEVLP